MRLFQYLSFGAPNTKLLQNSTNYLRTVFNINFFHDNEEISEDLLVHSPLSFSSAVLEQVDAGVLDFVKRHGFNTKRELDRVSGVSSYSANLPDLSMEQHILHGKLVAVHALVDDLFDLTHIFSPQHADLVYKMTQTLSEYFRCKMLPISDDIHAASPKFANMCRMYFELGTELKACGADLQYVYEGFDIKVGGYYTQLKHGRPKSAEKYLEQKTGNFGMELYLNLDCVLAGETLSEEVRKSDVFKKFQNVAAKIATLGLDPPSVIFDLSQNIDNDNYVVILSKQGISVRDAVKSAVIRYNQLFMECLMVTSQLDQMNISDSDRRYLRSYFDSITATLNFAPNHKLYNQSEIVKCKQIEDDDRAAKCVVEALRALPSARYLRMPINLPINK